MNNAIKDALNKVRSCKVITISPSAPKYSEVWMDRMNEQLSPDNFFIALEETTGANENVYSMGVGLSPASNLPTKLHLFLYKKIIKHSLRTILANADDDAIILCHYLTTAVFLSDVLKSCKQKVFIHCHGHDITWDRKVEKMPIIPAHGPFYKSRAVALDGSISIIANSNFSKDTLIQAGFSEKNILVNYLSVDCDELVPNYEACNEKVRILYLGRLIDCKGPLETIKAFELACDKGLIATLDIVGDGPLFDKCVKAKNNSPYKNSIIIHGRADRQEVMGFYSRADIFTAHNKKSLRTGQEEAFGVTIIEAMAAGLPVVTGASGGVKESIVTDETGFLFLPGSITAHSNLLLRLALSADLRRSMGAKGRRRVKHQFDIKNDEMKIRSILNI